MKRKGWTKFTAVIAVIILLVVIALYGVEFLGLKPISDARFGIDISGGVYATLYPDVEPGREVKTEELEAALLIIGQRLDARGIFDRTLYIEADRGRLVLEVPYGSKTAQGTDNQEISDQELIDAIGQTSLLTFQEIDENMTMLREEADGTLRTVYLPTGKVIVDGSNVKESRTTTYEGQLAVSLEFDSAGAQKFAEATRRLVGKPIAIFLDDFMYSAPVVNDAITSGQAIISGRFTAREARELADTIKYGSLPFKLVPRMINSISPTLGEGALNVAVTAGIIAFIIIAFFMIIKYKVPGVISVIALIGLISSTLVFLSSIRASITLPGIAGIILSVGMGVDANIIIFERIKEELLTGKSFKAAIDAGFKRAFAAILDANVTTMIVAVVLYMLGSGPIKGFGITLGLGVALSFLTALTASRIMLTSMSNISSLQKLSYYGLKEAKVND
jgi:preprotein translocase subunit SecD